MNLHELRYSKTARRAGTAAGLIGSIAAISVISDIDGGGKKAKPPQVSHRVAEPAPCTQRAEGSRAICEYAFRLNHDHMAKIAMDTCVAWPNTGQGITVTYNPGYDKVQTREGTLSQLMWSSKVDTTDFTSDALVVLNGPLILTSKGQTYNEIAKNTLKIQDKPGSLESFVSDRHISRNPSEDLSTHSLYFTDVATGRPIIRTKLAHGPLDFAHVLPICEELRRPEPAAQSPQV